MSFNTLFPFSKYNIIMNESSILFILSLLIIDLINIINHNLNYHIFITINTYFYILFII
jgi:hypothetical protein